MEFFILNFCNKAYNSILFISDFLLNRLNDCTKHTAILTDHNLVNLKLSLSTPARGPGVWKINNSLLKNQEFVNLTKLIIADTENQYESMENKGMLWDIMKMKIRALAINFSAKLKRERDKIEQNISVEIASLEKEHQSDETIDKIDILKTELENLLKYKTDGAILRSKIFWAEEGEKNTSYFLRLEHHKSENKTILQLKDSKENTIVGQKEILNELYNYYLTLYSDTTSNNLENNEFVTLNNKKLSPLEQAHCEGLIGEVECLKALKGMANGKTPGSDGLSTDFYKFFWMDIKKFVIDSFNYAFIHGELSIDQSRGLISLIPKKDKDRLYVKNWRPIALLNNDYKLLAKTLSNRIKHVIDSLISHDQTGYISGRYIGENIRTVSDAINFIVKNKKEALIILIDFEKAFDSIKWKFIDLALDSFHFGQNFKQWVKVLYKNSKSAVMNNGTFTQFFNLERGVRQGCPLSVYLFLLVVELLATHIRQDKTINGITLKSSELKISQMADDTTIFLKSATSIPPLLATLNKFALYSGLKTNVDKTKLYAIGKMNLRKTNLHGLKLDKGNICLLGLVITDDPKINLHLNIEPKLKLMANILRMWSQRDLSLKGKICVINSLIMSLFIYPATILGIDDTTLNEIDTKISAFLWN